MTGNAVRQYDLCQRYRLLAALLEGAFPSGPVRVLDVGAGPDELGRAFLPARFTFTLADTCVHDRPDFVTLQPGAPLPFADRAFDAVLAMDVLEHVPPAGRPGLLAELARVAAEVVVLSHPTASAAVVAAETVLAAAHRDWFGSDSAFLREHAEYGLPSDQLAVAALQAGGFGAATFPNCPLVDWLPLTVMDVVLLAQHGPGALKDEFNATANTVADGLVVDGEHYRTFVAAARQPARLAAMAAGADARQRPRGTRHGEALALLLSRAAVQTARGARIDGLHVAIAAKDEHIRKLDALIAREVAELLGQLAAKDAHIARLTAQVEQLERQLRTLRIG